jgi:hypothetical protein
MGASTQTVSPWAHGIAVFAGVVMIIGGAFQALEGLAGIVHDKYLVVAPSTIYRTCREAEGPSRSAIAGDPADAAAASEIRTPELSVANLGPPQGRRTWREPLDHMMSVYPPVSGAETPALASETAH